MTVMSDWAEADYYNYLDNVTLEYELSFDELFDTTPQGNNFEIDWSRWRKQNTSWYKISSDSTRLTLLKVTKQEEGLYMCEVSNEAGITKRTFRVDALG